MKHLLVITTVLFFFSCKENFDKKTYQQNKISLAQRESEHPQQFLQLSSNNKRNFFGITVIKGQVANTASVASYKNTRIKTLCYHNGIRVEEHEDVMHEILKPGSIKNFKIKYHLPKETDSLSVSIMSAEAISSDTLASSKK